MCGGGKFNPWCLRCPCQETETEREQLSPTAMGQEAEVADAHEAWGKHMEQKPAQELLDRQSQQALLVSVGRVSPAKGDLVPGQRPEAMVGEGDPMGIGPQIMEDIVGASERRASILPIIKVNSLLFAIGTIL